MTDRPLPTVAPTENLARPIARVAGVAAYVADLVILVSLVVQLIIGGPGPFARSPSRASPPPTP